MDSIYEDIPGSEDLKLGSLLNKF